MQFPFDFGWGMEQMEFEKVQIAFLLALYLRVSFPQPVRTPVLEQIVDLSRIFFNKINFKSTLYIKTHESNTYQRDPNKTKLPINARDKAKQPRSGASGN